MSVIRHAEPAQHAFGNVDVESCGTVTATADAYESTSEKKLTSPSANYILGNFSCFAPLQHLQLMLQRRLVTISLHGLDKKVQNLHKNN